MVKFWDKALANAIKQRKIRIKQLEKLGMGNEVMSEKALLVRAERNLQLRKQ